MKHPDEVLRRLSKKNYSLTHAYGGHALNIPIAFSMTDLLRTCFRNVTLQVMTHH